LILNFKRRTKYIQANWKKEWRKFILENVQKLWETYRKVKILIFIIISFSYDKHNQEKFKEFNSFSRIILIFDVQIRSAN
jgi:hypothetical protein